MKRFTYEWHIKSDDTYKPDNKCSDTRKIELPHSQVGVCNSTCLKWNNPGVAREPRPAAVSLTNRNGSGKKCPLGIESRLECQNWTFRRPCGKRRRIFVSFILLLMTFLAASAFSTRIYPAAVRLAVTIVYCIFLTSCSHSQPDKDPLQVR